MMNQFLIERICRLPFDFYKRSISMSQLILDTKIENITGLNVTDIGSYISLHPEIVELWLRWSENKRVSSGWYFNRVSNEYVVNFYPNGETLSFSHPEIACAEFIVREVQSYLP
jgi:hypothetical protein